MNLAFTFCVLREDYFTKKSEERKQNKIEAKLRAKQEQKEKQKLAENAEMKSLEEKIGCLLKFSGDLDDQTCREDLHTLFSNHGEIKWIHFVRGAKEVWRYSYAFYQSIKKPIETFILR